MSVQQQQHRHQQQQQQQQQQQTQQKQQQQQQQNNTENSIACVDNFGPANNFGCRGDVANVYTHPVEKRIFIIQSKHTSVMEFHAIAAALTCFRTSLVLPSYTSNAQLTYI